VSDTDGFDDDLEDEQLDDFAEEEVTALDRTRADYTGVALDDEFQPVDEVELAEEGLELADPERLAVLSDGADAPPRERLDADDIGWDEDGA
jgi:hypothetical protein